MSKTTKKDTKEDVKTSSKKAKKKSPSKIDILKKEKQDIQDKHVRLKAEFENFRRRKSEEFTKLLQYDGEDVIKGFLPIIDDLKRMIASDEDTSLETLKDGAIMVESKIHKFFDKLNVEPFAEKGDKMNPEMHDAMLTKQDKSMEDDCILEVFESGYTFREKVIRHAKVIVNKK
ncbi:nucleotide exchange factor GrpE [Candidatus Marinimicrobia bacterium]|nr:nucleotide exchange factor GrpE [Candidatus Neomarinimicrobiota bacterium]MDC0631152.1 nucleotide exchange factor GrpE [Candidatus Neomarinimicrobiota bacterium]